MGPESHLFSHSDAVIRDHDFVSLMPEIIPYNNLKLQGSLVFAVTKSTTEVVENHRLWTTYQILNGHKLHKGPVTVGSTHCYLFLFLRHDLCSSNVTER